MKTKFKFKGQKGMTSTEITVMHTEESAYTPDFRKQKDKLINKVVELLRGVGYNYSEIKQQP